MKELSIEEKSKCYDEAIYNNYKSFNELIERLESVKNVIKEHNYGIAMDILCKPYPKFQITTSTEFKESEDEKIRKSLIGHLKECRNNTRSEVMIGEYAKWISWLEKQGGHAKFINGIQVGDKVTRNEDGVLVNLSQLNRVAKKDEKQGKQKPADKVEPKFHKGEWIIHQGTENIYQVTAIVDNQYQLKYGDNYTTQYCEDVDRCARLWDIAKDAKDGDVLANNGNIILFKQISDSARPDYKFIQSYCFVLMHSFDFHLNGTYNLNDRFHPAIKEQRDTLMKAMAAAGYEWDAEHRQLKKIEQNPAWSEEDGEIVEALNVYVKDLDIFFSEIKIGDKDILSKEFREKVQHWLKLFKDRVGNFDDGYKVGFSAAKHNHWKPSVEQMNGLNEAIEFLGCTKTRREQLQSLYEQLKKLREK